MKLFRWVFNRALCTDLEFTVHFELLTRDEKAELFFRQLEELLLAANYGEEILNVLGRGCYQLSAVVHISKSVNEN
jgi:hypothetical protein